MRDVRRTLQAFKILRYTNYDTIVIHKVLYDYSGKNFVNQCHCKHLAYTYYNLLRNALDNYDNMDRS